MTEVTRRNFYDLIPEIEMRIRKCAYIALDAEYTGLHPLQIEDKNSLFDTPAKRYSKVKENVVSKFVISQIGLAFYEKAVDGDDIRNTKMYNVNAYNFYVFPVSFDAFRKREGLTVQISCANFLTKNGFDFNKFIKEGVPYLNREKVTALRKWLAANRHFMNTCEYIDPLYFPERYELMRDEDIDAVVNRLEGFSGIMKLIRRSGKPIVGHNVYLDLLLIHSQFIEDLPPSYAEWKKRFNDMFPVTFDTKCVAWGLSSIRMSTDPEDRILNDTNLFTLYMICSVLLNSSLKPLICPQGETYRLYNEELLRGMREPLERLPGSNCHTAAFDAVVTGAVFLKLGYLASRRQDLSTHQQGPAPTMTEILNRLAEWQNEVNVARCIASHINLSAEDPISKRPDWLRVKCPPGHCDEINPTQLRFMLAKFGDVEIEKVKTDEAIIACSGFGAQRKVRRELHDKGFTISIVKIASNNSGFMKWMAAGTLVGVGIVVLSCVIWRRGRQ